MHSFVNKQVLHYQVIELLGQGGMGAVYFAKDLKSNRDVALKFLHNNVTPDAKKRFEREAYATTELNHINLGEFYSFEQENDISFISMAFYEGQTLEDIISQNNQGLSIKEALNFVLQSACGLIEAHGHGIIHRDIKPANLFITKGNIVKILDFGLAKMEGDFQLTQTGALLGTPQYMSPEQARGQKVTTQTDLWSLGVVFYELLTGTSPFQAKDAVPTILNIISKTPPHLNEYRGDVPIEVENILIHLLEKDTSLRYKNAEDVVSDIEQCLVETSFPIQSKDRSSIVKREIETAQVLKNSSYVSLVSDKQTIPSNIPTQKNNLVGRFDELAIIDINLQDTNCRILTLLAAGGTGKTRLGIAAAKQQLEKRSFPQGVFFVSLDALKDVKDIPRTIANSIDFDLVGVNVSEDQLKQWIGRSAMLLVLDNYEHLMDAASLPAELVQHCPNLKIMVTSRERLCLEEEWVVWLEGFPIPTEELDQNKPSEVVQLFSQRAKQVRHDFEVDKNNTPHIIKIAQLVQGLPLAIELAATWIRMMSIEDIAKEVDSNLDFLATTNRNITSRHQSIQAVFEQSWQLLTEKEQETLCRLSVFRGGFTQQIAKEAANIDLLTLSSLLDKSLLLFVGGRYDMHPLINKFTQIKLGEKQEVKVLVEKAHCTYFLNFVARLESKVPTSKYKEVVKTFEKEAYNVKAVWQWLIQQDNSSAQELAEQGHYAYKFEVWSLAEKLLSKSIKLMSATAKIRASCLYHLGVIFKQSNHRKAESFYKESLTLARIQEDVPLEAAILNGWGLLLLESGDKSLAQEHLEHSLKLHKQLEDSKGIATSLRSLARLLAESGKLIEAKEMLEEALEHFEHQEDLLGSAKTLTNLGIVLLRTEKFTKAKEVFEHSIKIYQELGAQYRYGITLNEGNLGRAAELVGDYPEASERYTKVIEDFNELGNSEKLVTAYHNRGLVNLEMGQLEKAKQDLCCSLKNAVQCGMTLKQLELLFSIALVYQKEGNQEKFSSLANYVYHHDNTEVLIRKRVQQAITLKNNQKEKGLQDSLEEQIKVTLNSFCK